MGQIFSVLDKTITKPGAKQESIYVEILTKDQRKFSFYCKDLVEACYFRDSIKRLAFFDYSNQVSELMQVTFACKYKKALVGDSTNSQKGLKPSDAIQLKDMNMVAWSLYEEPINEFRR